MTKSDYILAYSTMLAALIPLSVLLSKLKHLNKVYRAVMWFLIAWLVSGLISWLTSRYIGRNLFTTHITSLLMASPVFYLFWLLAVGKFKNLWIAVAAGYILVIIVDLTLISSSGYNWLSRSYLVVFMCLGFTVNVLKLKTTATAFRMTQQPLYWVFFGLLIYYGGTYALDLGYAITDKLFDLMIFGRLRQTMALMAMALMTVGALRIPKTLTFVGS